MLSSRASQTSTQWFAKSASIVLKNRVVAKRLKKGYIIIKERKEMSLSSGRLEAFTRPWLSLISS